MALQANCPACGAQVIFKTGSSVVVVCEFCHSVVARTDRGFEDFMVDTGAGNWRVEAEYPGGECEGPARPRPVIVCWCP